MQSASNRIIAPSFSYHKLYSLSSDYSQCTSSLLKYITFLYNNQACLIDWNVMDFETTDEMASNGIITVGSDTSSDDVENIYTSQHENKHNVKKQILEETQRNNSKHNERKSADEKNRKPLMSLMKKYDVIIGSDLVYCQSDTQGILKVISTYLSVRGIFIIVVPKPRHRYGTEFLVPILQKNGFEVYSRCIAHSSCTSSEIVAADGTIQEKNWKGRNVEDICQNDIFELDDPILPFLSDLDIDDDWLVSGLDEHQFVAWNLIIGRRKSFK